MGPFGPASFTQPALPEPRRSVDTQAGVSFCFQVGSTFPRQHDVTVGAAFEHRDEADFFEVGEASNELRQREFTGGKELNPRHISSNHPRVSGNELQQFELHRLEVVHASEIAPRGTSMLGPAGAKCWRWHRLLAPSLSLSLLLLWLRLSRRRHTRASSMCD